LGEDCVHQLGIAARVSVTPSEIGRTDAATKPYASIFSSGPAVARPTKENHRKSSCSSASAASSSARARCKQRGRSISGIGIRICFVHRRDLLSCIFSFASWPDLAASALRPSSLLPAPRALPLRRPKSRPLPCRPAELSTTRSGTTTS